MIERSPGGDPEATTASTSGSAKSPAEEAALAARLDRLGAKLEAHRAAEAAANARGQPSGFARATKIASEFVAGVIVGGGIGWAFDRAIGTAPWGMILFVLLGFAAGVLNVLRAEGKVADAGARLREEAGRNSGSQSDRADR
jgi:ATP synthase protein I